MNNKERWGKLVRTELEERGESLTEFSVRFQCSPQAIQSWKRGSIPDAIKLRMFARLKGMTLDSLIDYIETGTKPVAEDFDVDNAIAQLNNADIVMVAELVQRASSLLYDRLCSGGLFPKHSK